MQTKLIDYIFASMCRVLGWVPVGISLKAGFLDESTVHALRSQVACTAYARELDHSGWMSTMAHQVVQATVLVNIRWGRNVQHQIDGQLWPIATRGPVLVDLSWLWVLSRLAGAAHGGRRIGFTVHGLGRGEWLLFLDWWSLL